MFPGEYVKNSTIVEYLVDFLKLDLKYILERDDPELKERVLEANRTFLQYSSGGTPPYFKGLCELKGLHYGEVVEIILREVFSEPNDIYWWLR